MPSHGSPASLDDVGLTAEELEAETAIDLPDREALSVAFPLGIAAAPAAATKGAKAVAEALADAPAAAGAE